MTATDRPAKRESPFASSLRDLVNTIQRRLGRVSGCVAELDPELRRSLFDVSRYRDLLADLDPLCDESGHCRDWISWEILCDVLKKAASLQATFVSVEPDDEDVFHSYAAVYDDLVGRPWLEAFIKGYLQYFHRRYGVAWDRASLLSVGCGTGLTEAHILEAFGLSDDRLLGIDVSEAMVREARRRIPAEIGDILALDPAIRTWDLVFAGLNVLQHLEADRFDEALRRVAAVVRPGGYFLGDFITPDHIRWYPNVTFSEDRTSTSLRRPHLLERDHLLIQRSDIVNVSAGTGKLTITQCVHDRCLPPIARVRRSFERLFAGPVDLFDAVSLEPLGERADTCASTRYLVFARKG